MIPIADLNPTRRTPYITIVLIVVNVLAFVYELLLNNRQLTLLLQQYGVVPLELTCSSLAAVGSGSRLCLGVGSNVSLISEWRTLLTSMFLHGGWAHLLGNMLYLWVFGDNIEDYLGHVRFIIFYLICGVIAAFAQIIIGPFSGIPVIGASGAIAGVLGGYLLLFPANRVITLIPLFFFFRVQLPAILVLGFWFVIQFFNGVMQVGTMQFQDGGVAFFAHIGGFVAGFILIRIFGGGRQPYRHVPHRSIYNDRYLQ